MKVTKIQRELMKHTISDPGRNWFGTNLGGKDSQEFEKLVEAGYANKQPAPSWSGDDVIYTLTQKGKDLISKV